MSTALKSPSGTTAPPTSDTVLVLARHAQTVWHADNRYAGAASDIDLTDQGRRQVAELARWAAGQQFDAVVSSPVRRAVETARPCAEAVGTPLVLREDLREVGFGIAEGHTLAELAETDPGMVERFRRDPVANPFPGAEPPELAARRAAADLREVAARYRGARVLVVAHNTLLRLALCSLLDLPIGRYRQLFPRLDNDAVTTLRLPTGPRAAASLLSLNDRVDVS